MGSEYFWQEQMTPEKIQLISKFTNDQLDVFHNNGKKAGEVLVRLDANKLNSLNRLSPETILVLVQTRYEELINTSYETPVWSALISINIDEVFTR